MIAPLNRTIEGFLIGSGSGHQDIARSHHGYDLASLDGGGPIQLGSGVFGNRARSNIERSRSRTGVAGVQDDQDAPRFQS